MTSNPLLTARVHKGNELIVDAVELGRWTRAKEEQIERLRVALERIEENDCPCGDLAREALR